ncbi:hypothetical protein [Pseudovibrio sp. WM33]|uniref:hypothetical protein n=1 Tax=Pseudovibrio sp. WM33 TaxID=1735585 RepID=UPI0007AEB9B9|nr:hypothetical protein [Pseudovibrio sp. WM33]KZL21777.1 Bifunctional hemolysin/adenylate cyclase precursor [Pseudovibrio sp. WM33]
MPTLSSLDQDVLDTILATYDVTFPDLAPEVRSALEDAVTDVLSSGTDIPEIKALSRAAAYANFNYGLASGLGATSASGDLSKEDENQAADIAGFIAKDFRVLQKLGEAIDYVFTQREIIDLSTPVVNDIKTQVASNLNSIDRDIAVIQGQIERSGTVGGYFYDEDLNVAATRKLATTLQLRDELRDLQTQLNEYEPGSTLEGAKTADDLVQQHRDFLQLQIDSLELERRSIADELAARQDPSNPAHNPHIVSLVEADLDKITNRVVDLTADRSLYDTYEETATTSKLGTGLSISGNLLRVAQSSAAIAGGFQSPDADSTAQVTGQVGNFFSLAGGAFDAGSGILEQFKKLDVSKGFSGVGAVATVGGNAAAFANVAQLLEQDLTPEQRKIVEAEVGLQGTALTLSAIEGGLSIAQLAVQEGSRAASVLGKAVPIIGAIGSVVGAINPLKWAEFSQKQERIDAIRASDTYSSDLLGDLLQETQTIEAAFYGTTTGLNVVTGVASGALAASGIGAPIAAAVGIIGGAVSAIVGAFEQVALNDLAALYADKIKTDENGDPQTVEQFFSGSFEEQQEKTKALYADFFSDLVADESIDQVIALGGQNLHATDIELAARTKTAGELNKTAQNFIETFTEDGYQTEGMTLTEVAGDADNVIQLPDANGAKNYLTFTTPLVLAGNESTSRQATGKNHYTTTLKVTDISGWTIRDTGTNATAFDLNKVVTSLRSKDGQTKEIGITVEAGAGDDTLFAYEAKTNFDGGDGIDTASYARLDGSTLTEASSSSEIAGLRIVADSATSLEVTKALTAGSKLYQEGTDSRTTNPGKETEVVEFRSVSLINREDVHTTIDHLENVEIIHGSASQDLIDVVSSTQIQQIFGFGGNDLIKAGDSVKIVGGGEGNDTIELSAGLVENLLTNGEEIYIDGGAGTEDVVVLNDAARLRLLNELQDQQIREQIAEDSADAMLGENTANRQQEVEAVKQSLTTILRNNDSEAIKQQTLFNTERVTFKLDDQGNSSQTTAHSLTDYRDAVNNVFVNYNTETELASQLNVGVDASDNQTAVSILGSDYNDHITGSQYNDYLYGGAGDDTFVLTGGNDIIVGGEGRDTYIVDSLGEAGHSWITSPFSTDYRGDQIIVLGGREASNVVRIIDGQNMIYSFDADTSITIENFFQDNLYKTPYADIVIRTTPNSFEPTDTPVGDNEFVINGGLVVGPASLDPNQSNYGVDYLNDFRANYSSFLASRPTYGSPGNSGADSFAEGLEAKFSGDPLTAGKMTKFTGLLSGTVPEFSETRGDAADNTLNGTSADDIIYGEAGNDVINGNAGDDMLIGGTGSDTIDGGLGFDVVSYENSANLININLETESRVVFKTSGLAIVGNESVVNVEGVVGSSLNDIITGSNGHNFLAGGAGHDTINANAGQDVIQGGAGNDHLTGGAGADVFVFEAGHGQDRILDFDNDLDQLSFFGIVREDLTLSQVGADTHIATGAADSIILVGVSQSDVHLDDFQYL